MGCTMGAAGPADPPPCWAPQRRSTHPGCGGTHTNAAPLLQPYRAIARHLLPLTRGAHACCVRACRWCVRGATCKASPGTACSSPATTTATRACASTATTSTYCPRTPRSTGVTRGRGGGVRCVAHITPHLSHTPASRAPISPPPSPLTPVIHPLPSTPLAHHLNTSPQAPPPTTSAFP